MKLNQTEKDIIEKTKSQLTQTEREVMNRLKEKLKDLLKKFNDDDFFPYPYIFKPPSPPGDDVLQGQLKPEFIPPKKKQEFEPYCKHCGAELPAVQLICPACGKKI